jgi:hypothetical protein
VPTGRIKHLGSRRQVKEPQNQLNFGIAATLQQLILEPEVILVEEVPRDQLFAHYR